MSGFPMDCVFCAIAGGREPAHRLFEDEHFIVLLDIFPLRPAHVLIVAREHAPHLSDLPPPPATPSWRSPSVSVAHCAGPVSAWKASTCCSTMAWRPTSTWRTCICT